MPQEEDQRLPGFCHEPHLRGARVGQAGQSGGAGVPGPVLLLRQLRHPGSVRENLPPGVSHHGPRQLHLAGGREKVCDDHVLPLPVGFELPESGGLQHHGGLPAESDQPRRRCDPGGCGSLHLEGTGDQLQKPAPGAHAGADDADDLRGGLPGGAAFG